MITYRSLVCFVLVSGYIAFFSTAHATTSPTGKKFYANCTVTTGTPNADALFAKCESYVLEIRLVLAQKELFGLRACIPNDVSSLSMITTAIEWMEVDKTRHHLDPDEALAKAFAQRWPCD